jgi:hypothetical protein
MPQAPTRAFYPVTFTPQRPCKSPGCSALIPAGQGSYCAAHVRTAAPRLTRRAADRARGSAAERGYDYTWQQARAAFLARYPLCPGVLIATEHWTRELAQQFHQLREQAREHGKLLIFSQEAAEKRQEAKPSVSSVTSCKIFLEQFPIYRVELTDVGIGDTGPGGWRAPLEVDHIVPHKGDQELLWAEWNWQTLTKRAHSKKTAREAKQRV